jgi:short-subunit dehydrogenase
VKPAGRFNGLTALVTGASAGIGAATARRLARAGMKVFLVARREDRLQRLAAEIRAGGREAWVLAADLTQEAERDRVHASAPDVQVLVNNAGFGWYGYGCDMPPDLASAMIQLNVEALAQLTLLYLPGMRRQGVGHVINVGSIAGSMPNQGVSVYSATKAFADAFTTALYRELRGTGVHISVVRPGPVSTEFYALARARGLPVPAERFAISAERVADCIWSVLCRPRRVAFVPGYLWLTRWVEPYFDWLIDRLGPLLLRRATGH